jgi:two-component system invasion response regulator UvrY
VREGLRLIVSDAEDIVVAAEASTGEEALDKLKTDDFDAVVLDISMPGKSGFDVLRELRAQGKETHVLLISAYAAEEYHKKAIEEGAGGFLSKGDAAEKLIDAIREVSRNK